jgi:hypothetical protein
MLRLPRRIALATAVVLAAAVAPALAVAGGPSAQRASFPYPTVKYCRQLSVNGAPRWGFRGGHFILAQGQAWALAHGTLNESTQTASGYLCQHVRPRNVPDRLVVMRAVGHYVFHSYAAQPKGGLSGNVLGLTFKVIENAYGTHCGDGATAHVTLYGSNNGDRSNSVQINFPAHPNNPEAPTCTAQDRSYHTGNATVHIPALSNAPAVAGPSS